MSVSVNHNVSFGKLPESKIKKNKSEYKKNSNRQIDTFEKKEKENKASNGKFDLSEASKNFFKGMISPITAMIKHPIITAGTVAATSVLCSIIPVAASIMTVGFGTVAALQTGKGIYDSVKNYKNGNYDNAEKSLQKAGQGFSGTILTLAGLKSSARVAKEAKVMSETGVKSLTQSQREAIAAEVNKGNLLSAVKENVSLLTTKSGLKASVNQLKPSMIKTRITELTEALKGNRYGTKEIEQKIKQKIDPIEKFKKTPEGIRRSTLSDEEISSEVTTLFDEVFDKLDVEKSKRPKITVEKAGNGYGGLYSSNRHEILFNSEAYKNGMFEMEEIIMHEATHCKEALLRAGIPQERVDNIVINELLKKIKNGENEEIIVGETILGAALMKAPEMSGGMKKDFSAFAKEVLYKHDKEDLGENILNFANTLEKKKTNDFYAEGSPWYEITRRKAAEVAEPLETMIKAHPEFTKQFEDETEALQILCKYALSHHNRFLGFSDVSITRNGFVFKETVPPMKLSPEQLVKAEESLINIIDTTEGNARISGLNAIFSGEKGFNQYRFSPEEVLAEQNGNKFLIEKLTSKIETMRNNGTLTPENEEFLAGIIEKSKLVIECRTKGLEYYKQYTKLLNNPNNEELAASVSKLAEEIKILDKLTSPKEFETIIKTITITDFSKLDIASMSIPDISRLFPTDTDSEI